MKKSVKVLLFVALGAVVLGAVICGLSVTIGGFRIQNFMIGERTALKTNTIEIRESFSSVDIEAETGDIVFAPSKDGNCSVDAFISEKADFSAEVRGDTLYVVCNDTREWYERIGFFFAEKEKLTITLPVKDYKDLSVAATTSDIVLPQDFRFENASVKVTSGDVGFAASVQDKLSIDAVTGDLTVKDTTPKELSVKVITGDIDVKNVMCGSLTLSGVTGDVSLADSAAEADAQLRLTTGDVLFSAFDAKNITVNITTGDVSGTLLSEKTFKTKVAEGDVKVPDSTADGVCEITLVTGDIRISCDRQK